MSTDHEMQHILFDHGRNARIGLPEAVFCEGKSEDSLLALLQEHSLDKEKPILFTRLDPHFFASVPAVLRAAYSYHELSRTAFAGVLPEKRRGTVAVVSAGSRTDVGISGHSGSCA